MTEQEETVAEFLAESRENLDRLDQDFVALEKDPTARPLLARIFRTIHTIKGASGLLGFTVLEKVTHAGENLLSRLRDAKIQLNTERTNVLLHLVDAVRGMLDTIESAGNDGNDVYDGLIATLEQLLSDGEVTAQAAPATPSAVSTAAAPPAAVPTPAAVQTAAQRIADHTVRVSVSLLDRLMNLAGETILVRNQLVQLAAKNKDPISSAITDQLSSLTADLYSGVMKTRMQPIAHAWAKYPRMVRDMAVACSKQVRLELEGNDTELDRAVIDAIRDPLTHLVRNAIDHGLETPEQRRALGKSPEGHLRLHAFQEAGEVGIVITDDGMGIDPERIRTKAVERKLISPEQAARLSRADAIALIFVPGFSTAAAVTQISGRGVGMDVVKTNIERLGGKVSIDSEVGKGTSITLSIPLTLAVIPTLLVTAAKETFAIPMGYVQELCALDGTMGMSVEFVHGAPVYRLRGKLLTLLFLTEQLGHDPEKNPAAQIVVLSWQGQTFGLVVDDILDVEDAVVKPVGIEISAGSLFSGATILGDGRVILILAMSGMLKRISRLVADDAVIEVPQQRRAAAMHQEHLALLQTPDGGQMAVPVDAVLRFELFPATSIERTGDREVVQYLGGLLPVLRVSDLLVDRRREPRAPPSEPPTQLHLLISRTHQVGFYVGELLDVVDRVDSAMQAPSREGVLGTLIVQQRATEVLDIAALLRMAGMHTERQVGAARE